MSAFGSRAEDLDRDDPLADFREAFALPEGVIYLDGNSLGPPPLAALEDLNEAAHEAWGQGLVRSWNTAGWIDAPTRLGDRLAGLIGADPGEVIVADSTSVNLFKLLVAALQARPERTVVLSEPGDFPTDLYMAQGAVRTLGGGRRLDLREPEDLEAALGPDTAVLLLGHVHYKSGRVRDMAGLTARAQAAGALVLWDLSHSGGVLPVELNACNVDLAVGCTYKYLSGGPGAPAYLFVAKRHQDSLISPLGGWMGHAQPFAFEDGYAPAEGIRRFACGTPPILSLTGLEAGAALALRAGPARLAAKARALGDLFIEVIEAGPAAAALSLASPRDSGERGGQVSFRHPQAYAIVQALIARGVIGDFRAPDICRFGFSPLFLSFAEVEAAAEMLGEVVAERVYEDPAYSVRTAVT
ncbi:kynureninase [Caulobacter ginsengisoli]|uniref:Kynureninase n=1 Tax=Caulobacter ginsengisoli TaxID=400775 RepID=A0ABU0IPC2_9CAUL|nr:kynureninase [Caulobacter ginsengisoli]MDQ0463857.1 kynureninase [Caulobacter ginsengisoli]